MKFINNPIIDPFFEADDLQDLNNLRKAVDFQGFDTKTAQEELARVFLGLKDQSKENLVREQVMFFISMLARYYKPDNVPGWEAVFHFSVKNAGEHTFRIKDGKASYSKGEPLDPTCTVQCDPTGLMIQFVKLRADDLHSDSDELSDDDLEMVAGGKGGGKKKKSSFNVKKFLNLCGAEATGSSGCGIDWGGAGGCGGDGCAIAIGGLGICGAAACGAATCAADACAAAACGADACAGAACGLALGVGGCAGNACGVDIQGGADVGPCAVNVIPGTPGV
ncbi:MAG: hypothetical protein CVV64_19930 [Candidatus Wallbacteria bacterium HGW-Wallbacteria-1]|jgi:hypothetical protein|uniref:Uncharacterized protein n=1 Tax=Candidatus Wallbacteria bacterium HGW-Wallbacteria-1 TaxID=2013854 RepID=A0A2N1PIM8_9BACT|nr:MAG: hypothetical protein CVV64_19930 [Candidatus Wallbacteria bacterium HGW-Wallbacteria-1]